MKEAGRKETNGATPNKSKNHEEEKITSKWRKDIHILKYGIAKMYMFPVIYAWIVCVCVSVQCFETKWEENHVRLSV